MGIDACCGITPERWVSPNQPLDLGGCQLDTLIAQRRQCPDRIAQEIQTVFLVGHQATDDLLNGFQRHASPSGGLARAPKWLCPFLSPTSGPETVSHRINHTPRGAN